MENRQTFKKKVLTLCQAFANGIEKVQNCLFKIAKALLKTAKKEVKKQNEQRTVSPFIILKT
jgi:hypothetical protein